MSRYEMAQLNIGKLKGPLDSPLLADFVSSLVRATRPQCVPWAKTRW
jgi:hypothetical protein